MCPARPDLEAISSQPFGSLRGSRLARRVLAAERLEERAGQSKLRRELTKRYLRSTNEVFDVEYRGMRLRLFPAENTCDMYIVLTGRHHEEDEFEIFEREIAGASVFVDLGANIGLYSLLASRGLARAGRAIAFEPDPRTAGKLRVNLALNDAGNVEVVQKAVGASAGRMPLFTAAEFNAGRNTLRRDLGRTGRFVEVEVTPLLDELTARGIEAVDVMKVDVEGFEDAALLPFFETAPRTMWPRFLMLEKVNAGEWERDLEAELKARGYEAVFDNGLNIHLRLGSGAQ